MRIDEIEARKAEIKELINTEGAEFDVDALTEEVRALDAEKTEIEERCAKEAELRNAVAESVKEEIMNKTEELKEEKRMFEVDSKEYRNAWLKNLMGRELDVEERTAITATDVIPTETLNEVVTALKQNPLLGKIDMMNIPGFVKVPVATTENDASWTATSTDSQDVIGYISLNAYQLIKTVEVPASVNQMSIPAFEAYLVSQLRNKIECALQAAVINGAGSGSSTAEGIITTKSTAEGTFTKAAVSKKDLLTIMGKLPSEFQNGACWIMPAAVFYGEVMNISDHNSFANINDGFAIKLFGHDVVLDDNCIVSSTDNILYGAPKHYRMNLGENIKIDKDDSVGFRSNSRCYRAVCLADGKLDMAKAFVRYTRATE